MNLRTIIVDDEPMARKGMSEYVQETSFLQLDGSFENASQAAKYLDHHTADLMLLDIRMPGVSGIEFLRTLKDPPLVIFTTAYAEHALEGFELDVVDYLVKPVSFARFQKAAQKAIDYFRLKQRPSITETADYFFIKSDHKLEKVNFAELLFVESMQNYCILQTANRKLISYITLSSLLDKLPADRFMKVHKSFIVSLDKVNAVDGNEINIGSFHVPISRALKGEVLARIVGGNLLSR